LTERALSMRRARTTSSAERVGLDSWSSNSIACLQCFGVVVLFFFFFFAKPSFKPCHAKIRVSENVGFGASSSYGRACASHA
jgi:hypothetical protein